MRKCLAGFLDANWMWLPFSQPLLFLTHRWHSEACADSWPDSAPPEPLSVCLISQKAKLPFLAGKGLRKWVITWGGSHLRLMAWGRQWISLWVQTFHFCFKSFFWACLSYSETMFPSLANLVTLGKIVSWLKLMSYSDCLGLSRSWTSNSSII